ncbi:putative membrane protein YphA (DoxX/SURF4 family) [Nocardioides daedukensis]|uniref:Putative membrane protein YphA (DoxX/SURF4 family) n=1 Tax=Nocardioides daedukensis TaxID=634462 RepID=A0A7Y9RVM5_9ACTN|nr:DoxX family protein [Nocardioides daedukensis]NYG57457.1 putative membrane protein YphA (DoxX/SURF4 family) [Nocardioides daedukensis]
MTPVRLIARPLLASVFFVGAANALKNAELIAPKAARMTDRVAPLADRVVPGAGQLDAKAYVRLNAGVQLVAASALATGRMPRVAALALAGSLVPTTLAGHAFWEESDPAAKKQHKLAFFTNTSVLGGLLLAGADTEGKPGLAWRAGNATRVARKDAKRLARDVRREAKLAKAQLT